jgi:predicted Rossmann fold flavoprotein
MEKNTDLIIIGAGAAGLMAACRAAELGVRAVVVERKHQPGRKLLMCGNNRCNLTSAVPAEELLAAYGEPVAAFLRPAITALPPVLLRDWFHRRGVPTKVHKDGRVFPTSESAADVLHGFTDQLREADFPILSQAPVEGIESVRGGGFIVRTRNLSLAAPNVLIATGGVSYPKTGSVGDGQKFATALGHTVMPFRPGLAGFDFWDLWLSPRQGEFGFPGTRLRIMVNGEAMAETTGEILCGTAGARGPALVNASRLISRRNWTKYEFLVDLAPSLDAAALTERLTRLVAAAPGKPLAEILSGTFLPQEAAEPFLKTVASMDPRRRGALPPAEMAKLVKSLKEWRLQPRQMRSLKEAMVTVGGVSLKEIDPETLQSRVRPGLYFAGEVMDVDGPSGGYNLHAAFATATLAVKAIAGKSEKRG